MSVQTFVCSRHAADNLMMPCICELTREAESQDLGTGLLTLWCGTRSTEDHRDTRFYEPPHQAGYNGPVSGWITRPDAFVLEPDFVTCGERALDAERPPLDDHGL